MAVESFTIVSSNTVTVGIYRTIYSSITLEYGFIMNAE